VRYGGERENESRDPDLHEVAEAVFARYVSHLVSDVETARLIEVPLGAGLPAHEGLLTQRAPVTGPRLHLIYSYPL
jgi:hypothetical protein